MNCPRWIRQFKWITATTGNKKVSNEKGRGKMENEMDIAPYAQDGYGRSFSAEIAETEGKLPLTRAVRVLAKRIGSTQKLAREILLEWGSCEWHHTGKYAQRTNYYDVELISQFYTEGF
jgi:hypothetical protein